MNTAQRTERLATANAVIQTLGKLELIWRPRVGICVSWINGKGKPCTQRWVCDRGSFYPRFRTGNLGLGGTTTQAVSQLVRYCQGKPCLPLSTWEYWAGERVMLWRDPQVRDATLAILENSDYPKTPTCIFCGCDLAGGKWDWFSLPDGLEGTGCWARKCDASTQHTDATVKN